MTDVEQEALIAQFRGDNRIRVKTLPNGRKRMSMALRKPDDQEEA